MWLVLAHESDDSARWAHAGLGARGLAPVELVLAEQLAAARWVHRVGRGAADVAAELPDGRVIHARALRGALNRLCAAPEGLVPLVAPGDRDYVRQELMAFYMSWLQALPDPVIGRPCPQGLCGAWRHLSEWRWLAARAGLSTPPYTLTSHEPDTNGYGAPAGAGPGARTVLVVAGRAVDREVPAPVREGCERLAALVDAGLLGVDLEPSGAGAWTFAGASPLPELRHGGEALLDALAAALQAPPGVAS
jgi:hypothetical protein